MDIFKKNSISFSEDIFSVCPDAEDWMWCETKSVEELEKDRNLIKQLF